MKAKAMIIVSLLFTLTAGAQTVNVHKTDGTILTINANEFDYIDFSAAGEPRPGTGHTPEGAVAVDLGLPSGTKWANMNVGAEKPEDYGLYFAWGETVGHTGDISDGRLFDWASYKWCNGSEDSLVKYAIVNNKIVLDLEDDAAYVNWGSDWRMPTLTEIKELLDNTTFERIIQNGVNGCKLKSKINGNSIFLPAAGSRWESSLDNTGTEGIYWSSTLYESNPGGAYALWFINRDLFREGSSRAGGNTIRPVRQ